MILQWKKVEDNYEAYWQGISLTLFENPMTGRWHCVAHGESVPVKKNGQAGRVTTQTWAKAVTAMHDIENRQQKLIMAQVRRAGTTAPATHQSDLSVAGRGVNAGYMAIGGAAGGHTAIGGTNHSVPAQTGGAALVS